MLSDKNIFPGAVDGVFSTWSDWSTCTEPKYCLQGHKTRTRTCTNPPPANGGDECVGLAQENKDCPTQADGCSGKKKFQYMKVDFLLQEWSHKYNTQNTSIDVKHCRQLKKLNRYYFHTKLKRFLVKFGTSKDNKYITIFTNSTGSCYVFESWAYSIVESLPVKIA